MVPVFYGQMFLSGLSVHYLDEEECTINQALFNDFLNKNQSSIQIRGEKFYGRNDWGIK